MNAATLDVVTIGRSSVDLYGQQIGSRLEDMATFSKAVGGCPTNVAIGTARLGLRAGVITRVGDEHMGRFVREQLEREGVVTTGVKTDPERLTALVLLGVRDEHNFPLIFYRDNCADAALCEEDVPEELIASARAVLVTGTHFARPENAAAQRRAIRLGRENGARIILDVDYRPNLWGLAGHGAGESRYIRSQAVTAALADVLPACDLIVGTEEELHVAGGAEDTVVAIRAIRARSNAVIVCKRGPMGCVVFPGDIPDDLDAGVRGPGFPVEVYNVLGAGDAFMSGFLRGWLRDEPIETCCAYANACGAFAVSRLLCSPESPTWEELQHFLRHGSPHRALRRDAELNHLHWATTRRPAPAQMMALAIDHRAQIEEMARAAGAGPERIARFKVLAVEAAARVAQGHSDKDPGRSGKDPGHSGKDPGRSGKGQGRSCKGRGRSDIGMLLDGTHGREAMARAAEHDFWIGRPVERPGSRPLEFDGMESLGAALAEWPVNHTVKCLCFYHPDDPEALRTRQDRELLRVFAACRTVGRELMIEIIAGRHGPIGDDTVATVLERLYALGIRPDWWKLEPQAGAAAWNAIGQVIAQHDPHCRGVVMLGLDAPLEELTTAIAHAARAKHVKGFAIGRTIFGEAARAWLAGHITDDAAVEQMASRFEQLVEAWQGSRRAAAA